MKIDFNCPSESPIFARSREKSDTFYPPQICMCKCEKKKCIHAIVNSVFIRVQRGRKSGGVQFLLPHSSVMKRLFMLIMENTARHVRQLRE